MLRLLAFIWFGCWHKWTDQNTETLVYASAYDKLPTYRKRLYRCERCGIAKAFRE